MPWLTSVNPREVEDRLQERGIFVDKCAVPYFNRQNLAS